MAVAPIAWTRSHGKASGATQNLVSVVYHIRYCLASVYSTGKNGARALPSEWSSKVTRQAQSFPFTSGRLVLRSVLRTNLRVWAGTLDEVVDAQAKHLPGAMAYRAVRPDA